MALPKYCVIHPNLDDLSGLSRSKISYDKKQTDLFLLFGLHHIFISLKIFHILKQFHIVFCMYKCTYKHLQNDTSKKKKKTKKCILGDTFSLRFQEVRVGQHLQTSASVPWYSRNNRNEWISYEDAEFVFTLFSGSQHWLTTSHETV